MDKKDFLEEVRDIVEKNPLLCVPIFYCLIRKSLLAELSKSKKKEP